MSARRTESAKASRGTTRADRAPKPDIGERLTVVPRAPSHLSARAKLEWRRLAPAVVGLGTLTTADLRAFEMLTQTLATGAEAMDAIAAAGLSVPTADGGLKPHPAVRILEASRNQARALLAEFGLTPRGRQGIDMPPAPRAANPFLMHGRRDDR